MYNFSHMNQTKQYSEWLLPFNVKRNNSILVTAYIDAA